MKFKISLALLLILFSVSLALFTKRSNPNSALFRGTWDKRIEAATAPTACKTSSPITFGPSFYQGPLIDTHFHIPSIPDGPPIPFQEMEEETKKFPTLGANVKISDIICLLKEENVVKIFAFFPVYPEIYKQHLQIVKKTLEQYPKEFVPFIMPPDSDNAPNGFPTVSYEELTKMLGEHPGMFKGFGEIGLYKRENGAKELPPDSKRLLDIYPVVRKNKLIVYFHLGEGQKESFKKILEQNPDINFIWHGDQLIQCADCNQNLDDVEEILENHPNAYYGIDELYGDVWLIRPELSKENFFNHFKNYEELLQKDLETWKGFIERHPDQVLWGTDRGAEVLWSLDPEVGQTLIGYARAFIGRLEPSVQEKIAWKNASKLIERQ